MGWTAAFIGLPPWIPSSAAAGRSPPGWAAAGHNDLVRQSVPERPEAAASGPQRSADIAPRLRPNSQPPALLPPLGVSAPPRVPVPAVEFRSWRACPLACPAVAATHPRTGHN